VGKIFISYWRADAAFHDAMLEATGNAFLVWTARGLHPHLHHGHPFSEVLRHIEPVMEEQRPVLSGITSGDEEAAENAVERHLRAFWKRHDGWTADEFEGLNRHPKSAPNRVRY
jgi:DNA-binding FadR family transcriptional regulator